MISCDKKIVLSSTKDKMQKIYSFTSAVCGFHYHRKFWKPIENEKLNFLYEDNNSYDKFEIKSFDKLWRNCRLLT